MNSLHIALIAAGPEIIGGHSVQAAALDRALRDAGHTVSYIPIHARLPRMLRWIRSIPYVRTIVNEIFYLASLRKIARADVVHVFSASYWSFVLAPAPAVFAAKLLGKPVIIHYHSGEAEDHLGRWPLTTRVLRLANEIVVPSEYLKGVFASHGFQIRVIPNLIDATRFDYRERVPLKPRLLSVRNLDPYYQVQNTIEAFEALKRDVPDATLTIVGAGSEEQKLRRLAESISGIRFVGALEPSALRAVYNEADIFLNSSIVDNQPVSILEAFAAGLPVISTPTGDIDAMLQHGEGGSIVPPNDPGTMRDAVIDLLRRPDYARRLAQTARKNLERYAPSSVIQQWLEVYSSVLNNRNLNVLLVVPWDQETGGVATVAGNLARHLTAHGHTVTFFHPADCETLRHKTTKWGFPGVELNLRAPFNREHPVRSVIAFALTFPRTLGQLVRFIRKNRIRVVNIHYPGEQFVYFAICRRLLPIRLVISVHGMDIVRWDAPATRRSRALAILFRAADLVVAPSSRFLRRCEQLLGRSIQRGVAIHNGTDVSDLQIFAERCSSDEPFVLTVTSFDEWKGVDVLIRAMAVLRDRGQFVPLSIAGDGPRRAEIEGLISALRLDGSVRLLGDQPRSAVVELLHQCTLFVLPSRFESFGMAVVEAMACGKAVVATRVDGVLEIIDDRKNGLLVEPDDPIGLADAISAFIADPNLRSRLGAAARERVNNRFLTSRMGEDYANAFREVMACP